MVNRHKSSIDAQSASGELQTYLHPDYKYYHPEWTMIRDAIAGERRIKEQGDKYLPPLDVEYGTSYNTYKERAVFVNMVSRTVLGLVGTVFRRPAKIQKVDKKFLQNITLKGQSFHTFCKQITMEVCAVGRVGVLVDMGTTGSPYLTEYVAENILSWRTEVVNGREVLTYVLLREITDETPILDPSRTSFTNLYSTGALRARYRVLILDNGVYKQRVYSENSTASTPGTLSTEYVEITPTRNGTPFDFIPMVIIGPLSPTPEVQKSPVVDIATLNIAHFRTSAQLEHGRFYTALPVYYVQANQGQESAEYHVGPSVVWEVPDGSKPGILEYYGTGLKSLTDSLTEKEEHIAQLGGRIMGIRPAATAESDNIFKMKQANEMSILLNITESVSEGMTQALRWYLDWQRVSIKDVEVRLNQDFKTLQIAARELRAIALLYQEGILPVQAVYESLQSAEFIPEDWTLQDFLDYINDVNNFPNQPDVEAMHEGYPDAKSRILEDQNIRMQEFTAEQNDLSREHDSDLQNQMFEQGLKTARFESQLAPKAPVAGKKAGTPPTKGKRTKK